MSTRNTVQSKVKWKFLPSPEEKELTEGCFLKLSKKLEADINLRKLFIGEVFGNLFSTDKGLCELVESLKVFPEIYCKKTGHEFLDFFEKMRRTASAVCGKNNIAFENLCTDACDLGIFKPQSYVADYNGELTLIHAERDSKQATEVYGTFYKIADVLYEPWIKSDNIGKMLELWTYALIKEHLAHTSYEVYQNVEVVDLEAVDLETLEGITKESCLDCDSIGQLDCLIQHEERPLALIECKMDKKFGWKDVRAFYGSMHLYGAQFGAIIIGHGERFQKIRRYDKENFAIFPNVLERQDFPDVLYKYLDSKLPN